MPSARPPPHRRSASRPPPPPLPTHGGGATAQEAVDGFLRAEVDGRFDDSFLFLTTAERENHRSSARWTAAHREFPVITGFQVTSPMATPDRVEVTARLQLEPAVDEIVGLVPAQADAVWVAVREADVWRVSLADSVITGVWPDDTTAPATVETWATSRQACADDGLFAAEWDGGLIGTPAAAADLCDSDGRTRLGEIDRLDPIDATPFVAAFGEAAAELARVVPILSPVELRAVVAPLGDQWLVVGALPPPT